MVEYTVTHRGNGEEYNRLEFMGKVYEYTMIPCRGGKKGNAPSFEYQVKNDFPDLPEWVMEAIDELDLDEDDSIEMLQQYEDGHKWMKGESCKE